MSELPSLLGDDLFLPSLLGEDLFLPSLLGDDLFLLFRKQEYYIDFTLEILRFSREIKPFVSLQDVTYLTSQSKISASPFLEVLLAQIKE
jgi:hypothetical protein